MPSLSTLRLAALLAITTSACAAAEDFLPGVRRIVFLGDSITYAGHYVDQFEAYLAVRFPDRPFEVLDLGLPSETVSGLSEPGHANGKFPRPDLHERLDRVLAKTQPDLVIACYGMNDGIYAPFSEERFGKYRAGIEKLRAKVLATGAKIVHITPPVFDVEPIRAKTEPTGKDPAVMFSDYDEVLTHYSEWLLAKRSEGWVVIDQHRVMRSVLDARRAADPAFTFSKDGVHPAENAHWIFSMELVGELSGADRPAAMALLNRLRDPAFAPDFLALVRQRGRLLTDAWLTDIGHQRPGMKPGLPVTEATTKAGELTIRIRNQAAALAKAGESKPL